jgi:hypothetical protein
MQRNGIEVETVGPTQDAVIEKHAREDGLVAQRLDHFAALGDKIGEVTLAPASVEKGDRESVSAAGLDPDDIDQLEHDELRIRPLRFDVAACPIVIAGLDPAIHLFA